MSSFFQWLRDIFIFFLWKNRNWRLFSRLFQRTYPCYKLNSHFGNKHKKQTMESRRKSTLNSPSADRHKSLHFKSSPSPLAWKDAYRQKCIQRLRTGREKLVDRFRNITVEMDKENDDDMDTDTGRYAWGLLPGWMAECEMDLFNIHDSETLAEVRDSGSRS